MNKKPIKSEKQEMTEESTVTMDTAEFKRLLNKTRSPFASINTAYLVTIGGMMLIAGAIIIGVMAVRPEEEFLIVSGAVFGVLSIPTLQILNLMEAREGKYQAEKTHELVNSELTAFKKAFGAQKFAEGETQGKKESEARTDKLAKTK